LVGNFSITFGPLSACVNPSRVNLANTKYGPVVEISHCHFVKLNRSGRTMGIQVSRKEFLRGRFKAQADTSSAPSLPGAAIAAVRIDAKCLDVNGTTCRLCEEHCEEFAISFQLMAGGRAVPMIDEASCSGCSQCISICPTGAIHPIHHFEEKSCE
jgi:ferredoxin